MGTKLLIETTNKIQEALVLLNRGDDDTSKLRLPQIAVVGGQSAGKSSVLESIVGFDFLPRGTNIVTRRPLIIQLITASVGNPVTATLKDSSTMPPMVYNFSDMALVKTQIVAATENHPKCAYGCVANDPLFLKIRSPDVLNLTLIDLPGMTRISRGKQPDTITQQIEDMVKENIEDKDTIILAVSPANMDIALSDAVKIAKEVDPEFQRTIGVLTKVDLMPRGSENDLKSLILSSDKQIPSIWIPVKNGTQDDINTNKSFSEQRKDERVFFDEWFTNMDWKEKRSDAGIEFLSKKLQNMLVTSLKAKLPKIEREVRSMHEKKLKELEERKNACNVSVFKVLAMQYIHDYTENFVKILNGTDWSRSMSEKWAGPKIIDIYEGEFVEEMEAIDPLEVGDIKHIIANYRGHDGGIFIPYEAFKRLVKDILDKLLPICQKCVRMVCTELKSQAQNIAVSTTSTALVNWTYEMTTDTMDTWKEECLLFVEKLIMMEKRINNNHPDHRYDVQAKKELARDELTSSLRRGGNDRGGNDRSGNDESSQSSGGVNPFNPFDKDNETRLVEDLYSSYFNNVIRIKVIDSVPKAIALHLVDAVETKLWKSLNQAFMKLDEEGGLKTLMGCTVEGEQRMREIEEVVLKLEDAMAAIKQLTRSQSGNSKGTDAAEDKRYTKSR